MSENTLFETEWFSVKETDSGYQYLEGRPGVIVLPVRIIKDVIEIMVRREFNDIHGEFITCITGRLDEGENLASCALRELAEEAGILNVNIDGLYNVGTLCYKKGSKLVDTMFFVILDGTEQYTTPKTDGTTQELGSSNFWIKEPELKSLIYTNDDSTFLSVMGKFQSVIQDVFFK